MLPRCSVARITVLALFTLLLAAACFAQINTGRINGSVLDPSGAAVPNAAVRAINEGTGVVTATETQGNGDFLLNFLLPGTYRIEVEGAGFQKAARTGVNVNAGGIEAMNFQMKVGDVQQAIEVEASAVAVSTETSELSRNFSHRELDSLPNMDRNPLYQMNLMPGANNGRGSGRYGQLGGENPTALGNSRDQLASLGGVNANANSVYIEGTFNREPQNGTVSVLPSIEGIEEVQIYTGKYNAEFGFSGSAVVNVITKSGSNDFHGSAFEYLRNQVTDAKPYFAEEKTPFRRNQFGASFGGPIRKNKLFFFGNYQSTFYRTSGAGYTGAPTPLMSQGDFSELYDPSSGTDAAGNTYGQIYDPYSRVIKDGVVVSATPFSGNVIPRSRWDPVMAKMNDAQVWGVANRPGIDDNLYYTLRVAQNVHQGDGRIDYNHSEKNRLFYRYSILRSFNDNASSINQFWQDAEADSSTINQNMQLTHFYTLSPTKMNELRLGANLSPRITTSAKSMDQPYNNQFGIKNGNLGDQVTQGLVEMYIDGIHNVGDPDWVAFIKGTVLQANEAFTWVKDHHNLKFGATIMHVANTSADTMGGDSPRGNFEFSSAMTSFDGDARPYAYPAVLLGLPNSSSRARFVGGWPYQTYWQNAFFVQDDWKVLPSLTLNLGLRYELYTRPIERFNRQANWDLSTNDLVVATEDNRSPSLNTDKKGWSPRVGFAWSPDQGKTSLRGGYGRSFWQAYWAGPLTILGLTYPYYAKSSFVSDSLVPSVSVDRDGLPVGSAQYDASGNLVIPPDAVIRGVERDWRQQRVDQFSLNLQREITKNVVIDVGYLGVRGYNNLETENINLTPPGPPGQSIDENRPLHDKWPQLGDIPIGFSESRTWYDALTAQANVRMGRYLTVIASYAHGRTFQNGNNLIPLEWDQYRGPADQDIAHIFNAQASTEIPVGRGRKYGSTMNPVLDAVIGGWQYSGFVFIRSGTRFNVSAPGNLNNGQENRPDRVANGNLPAGERTIDRWFDTTAFVPHPDWATYGNAGWNPLIADGAVQLDSSIFKSFRITEKVKLEFRWDMFNTFNHPDFNPPNSRVGSSSIGRVTSTSVDPRRMQFGLRLFF